MPQENNTHSTRPTLIARHHTQYSTREMRQFPQIQELDDFMKENNIHITSLFVAKTDDVHPGEMAQQLKKMILKSRTLPYYTSTRM